MKFLLSLLALSLLTLPPAARADEASHRKAAESLLGLVGMEALLNKSVDQMLQMQVSQNPAIAPYQAEMKTFLNKYMSWPSMKDDMIKAYTASFTEPELKELAAFYQTPVGTKTIETMPALMAKGAEMAQKRVQEHLPELQAAIAAKGAAAAGAGAAAAPVTGAPPAKAAGSPAKK
ncbi:MAG: DUF2059 domain-containing protein [Chthoniobacterales bacterium]